jgi:hypothetical protein
LKKKKRRAGMANAKGGGFEREICKTLSLWISEGKEDAVFWRSSQSGGRATLQARRGQRVSTTMLGDISAIHPLGHSLTDLFFMECKFRKSMKLHLMFANGVSALADWWITCRLEARRARRHPLMFAKQNHGYILVCMSAEAMRIFGMAWHTAHAIFPEHGLFIFTMHQFLSHAVRPK